MYTRKIPELSLFTKEKSLISNAKDSMVLLVKKNIQCCGSRNRKRFWGEFPWILPIWYCFFALKKRALSQVKTSVLTVVWQNKWFIMAIVGGDLTSKSRIRNTECTKGEELWNLRWFMKITMYQIWTDLLNFTTRPLICTRWEENYRWFYYCVSEQRCKWFWVGTYLA